MEISIPHYVNTILNVISSHGYIACIVGGCVRDMVLSVEPNDWDISTSAQPEEVMAMFPNSKGTGLKHGTVTVKVENKTAEITTFRSEGEYKDHRHPDCVNFISDLTTDLSRRDFTINAMAITSEGTFTDPFDGRADIERKLVRAVGDPNKRFEEDALRMLRAFRFSSRLGFDIENETFTAIKRNAFLSRELASERVRDEIEKILMTSSPETMFDVIECKLLDCYIKNPLHDKAELRNIDFIPNNPMFRFAAFCTILEKYGCINSTLEFLQSLRLDGNTIKCCNYASLMVKSEPPSDSKQWKQLLRKYGIDAVRCAAAVWDAFYKTENTDMLESVIESGECFDIHHLEINGNDLAGFGLKGKKIGEMLDFLLDNVIEFPENNNYEKLASICLNLNQ